MKILLIIGLGLAVVLVTGCSVHTVPVSSVTVTETKTDSIHTKNEVLKDSSFYKETVEEKTLPAATVGITLTPKQLDSLIVAIQSLPSAVSRSVVYYDPKARAMLSVLMDSIGNLHFDCTATEQKYLQKHTESMRYLQKLVNEKKELRKENAILKTEVRQVKQTWWSRFRLKLGNFGLFFIVFVVLVAVVGILSKFKKLI